MFWQYDSDLNGSIMTETSSYLMGLQDNGNTNQNTTENNTTDNTNTTNNNTTDQNTTDNNATNNNTTDNNTTENNTTNNTTDQNTDNNTTNNTVLDNTTHNINHELPFCLSYILNIHKSSTFNDLLSELSVPIYSNNLYNLISMSLWTKTYGVYDAAHYWNKIASYSQGDTSLGSLSS